MLEEDQIVVPPSLREKFLLPYIIHIKESQKHWLEQVTMHIGLDLLMMYLNCVRNVKFVLKIMLTCPFHHHNIAKLMVQDLSMAWILEK